MENPKSDCEQSSNISGWDRADAIRCASREVLRLQGYQSLSIDAQPVSGEVPQIDEITIRRIEGQMSLMDEDTTPPAA